MSSIRMDVIQHETDFVYQGSIRPVSLSNSRVIPDEHLRGMVNIIKESKRLAALLKDPINSDREAQVKVDAALELQITRLGLAMGQEAENRAGYNPEIMERAKSTSAQVLRATQENMRRKLVRAYQEIIAEIRSVGGSLISHPYSSPEAVKMLAATSAQYYPSDWIQASNAAGPIALVRGPKDALPNYVHRKHWERDTTVKNSLVQEAVYVTADGLEEMFSRLHAHDDSIRLESVPFEIGPHVLYGFTYNSREFFNPEIHDVDEDGKPVGDEWIYDTFRYDNEEPDYEGTYFRFNYRVGETIPTLTLPDSPEMARPAAYHEFMHRLEETLNNGVLKRQQIAFLARRTVDENGKLNPVSNICLDTYEEAGTDPSSFRFDIPKGRAGDFVIPYISREYLASGNREVLAVGAEMLFAEALGGFLGLDEKYEKIDKDHRGFVLGIFATA